MTLAYQSTYNLLDDDDFNMDDGSEEEDEEEWDEEEWDEEEEANEVEKGKGSDGLTSVFCEKLVHNNDDDDDRPEDENALWSASVQNASQHHCS
ncbi:hypothetical protein BGX24_005124 [Mortierella sp. AD032]|nr:hypothetical protein BGX24_005124 [Mortierella sp. AD032]